MKYFITRTSSILALCSAYVIVGASAVSAATATGGSGGLSGGGLYNPLKNINSFEQFVAVLLQAVVYIGLPIAVLFIVYAGFLFATAQGSEDKLKKAKSTFYWTIIGVTIFLGSWTLALIVKNTIKLITG